MDKLSIRGVTWFKMWRSLHSYTHFLKNAIDRIAAVTAREGGIDARCLTQFQRDTLLSLISLCREVARVQWRLYWIDTWRGVLTKKALC